MAQVILSMPGKQMHGGYTKLLLLLEVCAGSVKKGIKAICDTKLRLSVW